MSVWNTQLLIDNRPHLMAYMAKHQAGTGKELYAKVVPKFVGDRGHVNNVVWL